MRTTVTAGRGARLALLVCTLLGLAAMHTIGHDSHPAGHSAAPAHAVTEPGAHGNAGTGPGSHAHAVTGPGAPADVAHVLAAPRHRTATGAALRAGCVGDCASAWGLPFGGSGGELPGWGVCLAVLGALAVTLLVAALLSAGLRAVGPPGCGPVGSVPPPRGPPPRPVGLRLATVSVLRT